MKYRIWNADRAVYACFEAMRLRVASEMADMLEAITGEHMILKRVTA